MIVEKESQKCVGYVTVDIPYMQLGIGEIGYVIGEQHQHKGYAYESVKCILREYLVVRNLYMIEAKYNTDNLASCSLFLHLTCDHIEKNQLRRYNHPIKTERGKYDGSCFFIVVICIGDCFFRIHDYGRKESGSMVSEKNVRKRD